MQCYTIYTVQPLGRQNTTSNVYKPPSTEHVKRKTTMLREVTKAYGVREEEREEQEEEYIYACMECKAQLVR